MSNLALFLSFYALDIVVVLYFLAALFREARRVKAPLSLERITELLSDEFRRLRKGTVAFLHLSIFGGVGLSILFIVLYPLISLSKIAQYTVIAISIVLSIGLLAAVVWRVQILVSSRRVHRQLGEELRIDDRFKTSSFLFQFLLIVVILLTTLDLDLSAVPGQQFFYYASIAFIPRTLLVAILYVKPAINTYSNVRMKISDITTPFNMKEVIEGKVDPSSIRLGAENFSDFKDFELNSLDACVEIGACEAACPATRVSRPLSPRVLVRKLAMAKSNGSNISLQSIIGEEELWSCTSCAACVYSCPVDVKHLPIIVDMRRKLVEQGKLDRKKSSLLLSLGEYGNTFSTPNQTRNEWLKQLGIQYASEGKQFDYLFWVGCMGSFDARMRKYISDFVEVLKKAGMIERIAILGDEETCCGDPARRLGEESKFQELALSNIERFKKYNVKRILLICPHGLNTFKNEYANLDQEMKNIEVVHHAQLIEKLVEAGRLNLSKGEESYVIHDPCYLSRYNGIVAPQRKVLDKVGVVKEAKLHGENTFCCGAGGSNYWYEVKERKRISHERFEQLAETKSENIVTMCPFCNAMIFDAVTTLGKGEQHAVRDISEVVKEALT
ncbi:MAG: (Fe-S)-binding protein [Conexivisphaerales archaeon]